MSVIEEVVSKINDWVGKEISITALSGGLTNTNYKITVDGKPYFVRVPGASTELLAIDRRNEYHNTRAASDAGVAPKVLYHLPEYDVMVIDFLDGKTMSKDSLNRPGMPTRMAQAIRKLRLAVVLVLSMTASLKLLHVNRRVIKANDMAPKAPSAPASVGVKTPE